MKLKAIMLSKISQPQEDKYSMISLIGHLELSNSLKEKIDWWLPGAGEKGE